MNRPRSPAGPFDPETAARLARLLDPAAAPSAGSVRRPEGPPQARLEVVYVLELPVAERPVVEVLTRRVLPGGKPGPWEVARISEKTLFTRFPEAEDRELVGALLALSASTASAQLSVEEGRAARFALSRAACARVLPLLGRTGRFRLRRAAGEMPLSPFQARP